MLDRSCYQVAHRIEGVGNEAALTLARDNALAVGAGHTFLIFLGDGFFPVNVLAAVRAVPEVCRIFCATANPTQVIVAQTELGRGVLGVVDGASPLGVESDADIAWRKDLLRKLGYVRESHAIVYCWPSKAAQRARQAVQIR